MKTTNKLLVVLMQIASLVIASTVEGSHLNLVAWYKFDEISGNVAKDSSGNVNDGKLVGVTWAPKDGKFGGAINFDGTASNHVEIPTAGMEPSAGTISLWAKLSGSQVGIRYFVGHTADPSDWTDRIQLYMGTFGITSMEDTNLNVGLGDHHEMCKKIINLETDKWYHLVLTWNGMIYVVYVDGAKVTTGIYTGLSNLNDILHIGNNGSNLALQEAFCGFIDDVTIFNCALSELDVSRLYSKGVSSLISEPMLVMLSDAVEESKNISKKEDLTKAILFLENKISEYEKWKSDNPNDIEFHYRTPSYDLYLQLAKTKEVAGVPKQDIVEAYKKSVSQLPNSIEAFLWMFKNMSSKEYVDVVRACLQSSNIVPDNLYYITPLFSLDGNWDAFKLFLDATFTTVDTPAEYAENIIRGLEENQEWAQRFKQYYRDIRD